MKIQLNSIAPSINWIEWTPNGPLHPATAVHTFSLNQHGRFTKTDHILDHKTQLNKFRGIEIT